MIDGHVHFHKQPYTLETIERMVNVAISKGIDELYLLDHTHKFIEFKFLYTDLKGLTKEWFDEHKFFSIKEYLDFINEVKKHKWPIKLHFGLEVCYSKNQEKELKECLKHYHFDFLIGSIHFVNGVAIAIKKEFQEEYGVDQLYIDYFKALDDCINSKLFTFIAHPDLIKKYNLYPSFSLIPYYEHLALTLKRNNQEVENNTGLLRFGINQPGMAKELIDILKINNIKFHKSSDAHVAEDIGRSFESI